MDQREIYEKLRPLIDTMTFSGEERHISFLSRIFSTPMEDPVILLVELAEVETDPMIKSKVVMAMGDFADKRFIASLKRFLADDDDRVRANTVESLGKIKDPAVVNLLTPMLEDSNNRVVANSAMALWKFGGLRMLNTLVEMLEKGKNEKIQASAAFALGEIGGMQVVPHLMKHLDSPHEMVRTNILRALGKSGDEKMLPSIKANIYSQNMKIRESALEAIGKFTARTATEILVEALEVPENQNIIETIIRGLANSLKPEMVELIPQIVVFLKDEKETLRIAAARIIGNIGEPALIPSLKSALKAAAAEERNELGKALKEAIEKLNFGN
ncbi:MAG: hypothetical protein CVV64_17530 [Candidatus Wallbacteria bacterium HGW-Wallbacteria-1]|jgi:HEAT repeat protein|uniref:HEAT repeat domain-containing protein n=1 Tax=Candidatus Wallbacteria bacterium HGW-Wallbacteria-1 TaxID=2013854 RepID=A0A2N1PK42_9BACT|nr:MAG: hypothetical protein CVV64_17530 [Candidatus Wallbacteria bacterium HGW-Wallbacteria-1]